MRTAYFTFGQAHKHVFADITFDRDIAVKITAENPRAIMQELFGSDWSFEYAFTPESRYFPRGIYELKPPYPTRISPSTREYLGDSVYAEFDGHGIVLTTENGRRPTNRIVLDSEVYRALLEYVERIVETANKKDDNENPPQAP